MPCVRAITFGPLRVNDACKVHQNPIPAAKPPVPTWGAFGMTCELSDELLLGTCGDGALKCAPKAEQVLPPNFWQCVLALGDWGCDGPDYTERYMMHDKFEDYRSCTDCGCSPPEGGVCEGLAAVYKDSMCSVLADGKMIDSTMSYCADLMEGIALGSKEVTGLTYFPGACQPTGGELTGTIKLVDPKTVCCLPPPSQ
jgi:hypothetical protein